MAVVQNYLPGDPLLIDKIVYELKSQGIFDQFRKECIADVDTKPAYQNLRQRVEGSVSGFLSKQKWSSDMNKNQLREMLRKNIHESGFLETGVERIVDQVVNPKINSVFLPKVTEVVYKYLGIEKQSNDKKESLKLPLTNDNLLPTDLEAVSPESEKKFDASNDSQNLDDSKIDEDESPPFEPLEEKIDYIPMEENSVDSHLSGFSGLMSHDSNHSQGFLKPVQQMEVSNQDSALSKQSSEGRLSIVMSDDNETKMEICEDSQQSQPPKSSKPNDVVTENIFAFAPETLNKGAPESSNKSTSETSNKSSSKKSDDKIKGDSKSSSSRTDSRSSHEKHRSRHDSKSDRKDDKYKKADKDRKDHKDKHSSKDRDKTKEKDKERKDSKNGKSEKEKSEGKTDKDKLDNKNDKDRSSGKSDKDRNKSSSSSSNRHSTSSSSKDKTSSSSKKDSSSSSSSKDKNENKERSKSSSGSSSNKDKDKDRDSKYKTEDKSKGDSKSTSKSDKHKKDDKHRSDRHHNSSSSNSKSRDKDKKDSKKYKKENKDDHFSSKKKSDRRSTDRDSNDGQSGLKSSSSSFDSYSSSSQTQNKTRESSNSNSNPGSGDSGNSEVVEECPNNALVTVLDEQIEDMQEVTINTHVEEVTVPVLKLIKPKFASNIHEARRLMKIRKQLTLLEKHQMLDLSRVLNNTVVEKNHRVLNLNNDANKVVEENKETKLKNNEKPIKRTFVEKMHKKLKLKNDKFMQNATVEKNRKKLKLNHDKIKNKVKNLSSSQHKRRNNINNIMKPKNNTIIRVSPVRPPPKEVTPPPPSPPLKSSVVSAATWDALEAKLHESIKYSTGYDEIPDTPEKIEKIEVVAEEVAKSDDCLYLEPNSGRRTEMYMKFTSKYIESLNEAIEKYSILKPSIKKKKNEKVLCIRENNINKNLKRKLTDYQSDLKNNNKKFNTHHIEVHENFSLPLSPAESDNSIDKKSDISENSDKSIKKSRTDLLTEQVKKTIKANNQRYSSEDLYKPRPLFSGSRRRAARSLVLD